MFKKYNFEDFLIKSVIVIQIYDRDLIVLSKQKIDRVLHFVKNIADTFRS